MSCTIKGSCYKKLHAGWVRIYHTETMFWVDDQMKPAGLVQPRQGPVPGIRRRIAHLRVALDYPAPVLPARVGVGEELGELDRAHPLPQALDTWGPRKSGMPLSVEIAAPLNATV